MFDRKEYDRIHTAALYEEFQIRKERLVREKFEGKCFLCDKEGWKGFHFHHIWYHETESNYPRHSKAMNIRWKRLKEAEQHPERFKVLCGPCHRLVESLKNGSKYNSERLKELL